MKVCTRVIDDTYSSPNKAGLLSPMSALSKRRFRMFKLKIHHSEQPTSLGTPAPLHSRPRALCPPGDLSRLHERLPTALFRRI